MRAAPALAFLLMFLAGCQAPPAGDIAITHVHGMAFDPDADALFVATHHGLARGNHTADGWTWSYVGSDRYDYMGFTQDIERPGVFYSSGHPDNPRAFGGTNLGLRRSMDGGETWEQRSLKGVVDFHALTSLAGEEGLLAGYWQGKVTFSPDAGATWLEHPSPPAAVLALADAGGRVLAATVSGLYENSDFHNGSEWRRFAPEALPAVVSSVAASTDGRVVFASTGDGRSGSSYRSTDGGATWTQLGPDLLRSAAAPVIFAVDPMDAAHVFASTAAADIMESRDAGVTWKTIR